LRKIGVSDQDGVALLSHNDIYFYVLGDGAIAAGATFAGIPTFVKHNELANCIEAARIQWLFVAPEFLEMALNTASSMDIDRSRVIVYDPPGLEAYSGPQPCFSTLLEANESEWQNPYNGKDPKTLTALRLFTSGTTGSIKAADISHAAQVERIDAQDFVPAPQDKGALHTIGIYHASGQITCNRACAGKLPAFLSSADDAPAILDRIYSCQISVTTLPPRMIEAITATIHAGIRPRDYLQTLNTIMVGGSPSRKEAIEEFNALLPSHTLLRSGYGSTEAGNISMTPSDAPWTPGYVGYLSPKVELQ
jgi:4-coumarate--CoA ligase